MQGFYTRHFIISVQKLIFALAHLMEGQELYACQPGAPQQVCNPLRVRQICVKAGNHGNPGQDRQSLFLCPSEILMDQAGINTAALKRSSKKDAGSTAISARSNASVTVSFENR